MTFSTWLQPFQEPTMLEFRLYLFVQVTETFNRWSQWLRIGL